MSDLPVVSVVIPVYNSEAYLRGCVGSVLVQTLTEIEIILVDDASADSSPKICHAMAAEDSRIVAVKHSVNMGEMGARRTGVSHAQGEWIFFVDSDDTISDVSYLANLLGAVSPDTDLVVGDAGEWRDITEEEFISGLLSFRWRSVWGKLYRRRLWDTRAASVPPVFKVGGDFLTNLRIAANIRGNIRLTDIKGYRYNISNPMSVQRINLLSLDYELMMIEAVTDEISFFSEVHAAGLKHARRAFLRWRLTYLAGMMGLRYPLTLSFEAVRKVLYDVSAPEEAATLSIYERTVIAALRLPALRILFIAEKRSKQLLRRFLSRLISTYGI